MDYEGQRLSELIFYWIILSFGAVGWVIGYFRQDFTIVFQCWLVGVVLSVVVSSRHELPQLLLLFSTSDFFRFVCLYLLLALCA